jgi:hypothetical protein
VLMCIQALDAAGKDGTIRHVMSGVNPQGVHVSSFKLPSAEELDHVTRSATELGLRTTTRAAGPKGPGGPNRGRLRWPPPGAWWRQLSGWVRRPQCSRATARCRSSSLLQVATPDPPTEDVRPS